MGESYYIQDDEAGIEESTVIAARKKYTSGEYEDALKLFSGLLNTSADAQLYYETAMCYYRLKQDNEAIEHFKKSLSLGLRSHLAYSYLGNIYYRQKDVQNAIKYWHLSRYNGPEDEAVCLNLAVVYYSKGMIFEAMIYYENYLKYAVDKTSENYKAIQKNINKCFSMANDYNIKGEKAEFARDYVTARTCYIYAVNQYPILFEPNFNLGKLYFDTGYKENAIRFLKQGYKINSENKQLLLMLGDSYAATNEFSYAYCYYKRCLDKSLSSQSEYLTLTKKISKVKPMISDMMISKHVAKAKESEESDDFYTALEEYENYQILSPESSKEYVDIVNEMRLHINPESSLIKTYITKGVELRSTNNFKEANKYFTKVMLMSGPQTSEYRVAKSKLTNV